MARDKKLFKEFKEIHNDKGQRVGVVTYESWLEDKLNEARTKAVNKNALLADVSVNEMAVCRCKTNNISIVFNGVAYCEDCELPKAN